jgi:hypothetical protein
MAEKNESGSDLTQYLQSPEYKRRHARLNEASARAAVLREAFTSIGIGVGGVAVWVVMGLAEVLAADDREDSWLETFITHILCDVAGEGYRAVVNDPEHARRELEEAIKNFDSYVSSCREAAELYRDYPSRLPAPAPDAPAAAA